MRRLNFGVVCLYLCACSTEAGNGDSSANAGTGGTSASAGASSGGSTVDAGLDNGADAEAAGAGGMGGLGAQGGEGGDSADSGSAGSAGAGALEPQTLEETGLYADASLTTLAVGVMEYAPRFELWSDDAEKRRFIWLPPGTQIDTSDMESWKFPIGTKLWKEFARGETRLETRLLHKLTEGEDENWFARTFVWDEAKTGATLVRKKGLENVLATTHDIPSSGQCAECHHGMADFVLGFGAIQLSNADSPTTLQSLKEAGLLSDPPAEDTFVVPGDEQQQEALGLLHANCGHCHNPLGSGYDRNNMETLLRTDGLSSLEDTLIYQTALGVDLDFTESLGDGVLKRLVAGDPEHSAIWVRMQQRDEQRLIQMPPLGTEDVDEAGSQLVYDWISSLPAVDGGM